VRPLAPEELTEERLEQALWVFSGALGFPRHSGRVVSFADTLRRHSTYGGFRAFGAFSIRDRLVGFSYGYSSQPGLWWREEIMRSLSHEQRQYWLNEAFELAELHVHPSAQGRHLGSRLHDLLIGSQPHPKALLSVMHRSQRARQLYTRRGWQTLVHELRFPTDPATPFSILGLEL
jgi:ribosomal protein S18 acetylase RimI-like enzyme